MVKLRQSYGLEQPIQSNYPLPVIASRTPTTSDKNFTLGQMWVYAATNQIWALTSVVSGSATWSLLGPGASDVDTLTGDSGGAISPAGGNITLAGGTNVTTAGAGSTITFNLDAAISLATSVTSPLYTAGAGVDVDIEAPTGQDVIIKLGDAAGANKLSVTDSADSEVFAVDSTGTITFSGLTVTGAFAQTGGTFDVGQDNAANAISIGGGTTGRAIGLGNSAATHVITIGSSSVTSVNLDGPTLINDSINSATSINTGTSTGTVSIGNAAAGAIAVDTAAGISLDAATASNFTVTGAADLTLASTAGAINVTSAEADAAAIRINASDAAGGIDIDCGTAGAAIDSTGAVSIDAAAASNFSVSGAGIDLTLASAAGRVIVNGEEAAANAITLLSAAGGIDADAALQVNIASSQNAADAVVINASAGGIDITAAGGAAEDIDIVNTAGSVVIDGGEAAVANAVRIVASAADGGIDVDAGTGGIAIDSTGAISIDGAAASNFSVSGAGIDLTLASAAGRVVVNGEEAAADAVRILSAAGGLDVDVALQMSLVSSQNAADAIVMNASAGGIDITAAGAAAEDIDITCTAGSVNITAGEAVSDAIVISASNAAGGITIDAGSGGTNFTGANVGITGGNLSLLSAASQLRVEGGAATDFIGQAVLVNGQVTVSNTNIAATDRVFLSRSAINASTALGHLLVTINAGSDFVIESKQAGTPGSDETGDLSTIDYFIVRQL